MSSSNLNRRRPPRGYAPAAPQGLAARLGLSGHPHELGVFVMLIAAGVAAVIATAAGVDPFADWFIGDLHRYGLPVMQQFAETPMQALRDYDAPQMPLYFALQGGVLALTGNESLVRAVSVLLGVGAAWAAWRLPVSTSRRLTAIAVLMISPSFRGQVWHSGGDVLALLLMLLALRPQATQAGRLGSLTLAAASAYVRLPFLFFPAWQLAKGLFKDKWTPLAGGLAILLAWPLIGLLTIWGGITPPSHAGGFEFAHVPVSLGVGVTITAFHLVPILLVRALKPRRLLADLRAMPLWVHAAILGMTAIYVTEPALFAHAEGQSTVLTLLRALDGALGMDVGIGFVPAFALSAYAIAVFMRGDAWANMPVLLGALAMSMMSLTEPHHFDPLIPLLLVLVARRPELVVMERRGMIWAMAAPTLMAAIVAARFG